MWVQGIKSGLSARASSALKFGAIYPAPKGSLLKKDYWCEGEGDGADFLIVLIELVPNSCALFGFVTMLHNSII